MHCSARRLTWCDDIFCDELATLLLPQLFDVDPATGTLLDADQSDRALVKALTFDESAGEYTFTLDPTRTWSDGEPVTADDVLLSLIRVRLYSGNPYNSGLQEIAGVRIIDPHTLALRFAANR